MITLLILINLARFTPLTESPFLDDIAQERAEYLCEHKQWSHAGFDKVADKVNSQFFGENLAKNFPDDHSMFTAFMNSLTHRINMLDENYKLIGIGKGNCNIVVNLFSS